MENNKKDKKESKCKRFLLTTAAVVASTLVLTSSSSDCSDSKASSKAKTDDQQASQSDGKPILVSSKKSGIKNISYKNVLSKNPKNKGKLVALITFDGSKTFDRWEDILQFTKSINAKATFFISGVYFIADKNKNIYHYPSHPDKTGISEIGFGGTEADVKKRIEYVKRAMDEGHEIGSHLNGHFDGTHWSEAAWTTEIEQFHKFTKFVPKKIKSLRFPLLAYNYDGFKALNKAGYNAIMSTVADPETRYQVFSFKNSNEEMWGYPIPSVREEGYRTILMDYNFFYDDIHYHKGWSLDMIKERIYKVYLDEAKKSLESGMPLFVSHHFSLFKHGAYWEALKRALNEIDKLYDVRYVTVSELTDELKQYGAN